MTIIGGSSYLKATVCPEGATNKCITWCSSNTSVATVNPTSGLVMAQGAGTAIIYATAQDGSGKQGSCVVTVECCDYPKYCGGSSYRDVTLHTMVLQCDGYYVCSRCGYRIKSPALQDKNILSTEDYYKVLCCYLSIPYYSTIEKENNTLYISTHTLLSQIDDIRSKSEYSSQYDYVDFNGVYKREYTTTDQEVYQLLSVRYNEITSGNLWLHNGIAEAVVNFVAGFFVPKAYIPFFTAATSGGIYDGIGFLLSDLADKAGYPELGLIIDLILLGSSEDKSIEVTDKVIYVSTIHGPNTIESKFVFSSQGILKAQYNSYKTTTIIA